MRREASGDGGSHVALTTSVPLRATLPARFKECKAPSKDTCPTLSTWAPHSLDTGAPLSRHRRPTLSTVRCTLHIRADALSNMHAPCDAWPAPSKKCMSTLESVRRTLSTLAGTLPTLPAGAEKTPLTRRQRQLQRVHNRACQHRLQGAPKSSQRTVSNTFENLGLGDALRA